MDLAEGPLEGSQEGDRPRSLPAPHGRTDPPGLDLSGAVRPVKVRDAGL